MDLSEFVGKIVKIDVSTGFYYEGLILDVDEFFMKLKDKRGNLVTLSVKNISSIREVKNENRLN